VNTPLDLLKKYWHYDAFRPLQEEIIAHVLAGKDTLAILPTGGGKSVCYQLPAMAMQGNCLVVSPLIALMKDQALGLLRKGIPCLAVTSGMTHDEVREAYEKMCSGKYKFMFVSPERLKSNLFLDYLQDWDITLLAVDEAHCVSQWGYDFRPPYLEIAEIKTIIPHAVTIALTASATPAVQQDIVERLQFGKNSQSFFSTFERSNISFSSLLVENKIVKAIEVLQKINACSIVYCRNRRRTKELAETLISAGIVADYYHAGLSQEERNAKQHNWIENKTQVIVCTNAFGMGIDKSDVRMVLHYDVPDTPEAYYQEAGRAGRDGVKSFAVILYQQKDLTLLKEGIALKYPSYEKLKEIYVELSNYLGVGEGSGQDESFDFNVHDFCAKFDENVLEVLNVIKLLEQQEYIQYTESVFLPSRVSVITTREIVEELEKSHPEYDETLKLLLRMYGGIWNHYVPINEFQMALKANISRDYIEMILDQLHKINVIDYIKAKDKPQLTYTQDRRTKYDFFIDKKLIETLKKWYTDRVQFMICYLVNTSECRSKLLVSYFAEALSKDCGICDVCVKNHKKNSHSEFESIKNTILQEIALCQKLDIQTFCHRFSSMKQTVVMEVIRFMLDENQLTLNAAGELILNKK
jgi:ATP-dependent DNA helicase RecQ